MFGEVMWTSPFRKLEEIRLMNILSDSVHRSFRVQERDCESYACVLSVNNWRFLHRTCLPPWMSWVRCPFSAPDTQLTTKPSQAFRNWMSLGWGQSCLPTANSRSIVPRNERAAPRNRNLRNRRCSRNLWRWCSCWPPASQNFVCMSRQGNGSYHQLHNQKTRVQKAPLRATITLPSVSNVLIPQGWNLSLSPSFPSVDSTENDTCPKVRTKRKEHIFKTWGKKVNGPISVTYLDRTPILNNGWLGPILRMDTQKKCFREIELSAQHLLTILRST